MNERGFYESAYPDSDEEHQRQRMLKSDPDYVRAFNAGWRECEQTFRRAIRELSRDGKLTISSESAPSCRVCAGNGETGMERDCPACGGTGVAPPGPQQA